MLKQMHFMRAQKHHAEHYLKTLIRLNSQYLAGGTSALQAIHKLKNFLPQINHARLWSLAAVNVVEHQTYAVKFVELGQQILSVCLSTPQVLDWANTALLTINKNEHALDYMNMVIMVGKCHFFTYELNDAMFYLEQGLELAQEFDALPQLVEVNNMLGLTFIFQGDPNGVIYSEEALRLAEILDNEESYIKALGNLGVVYRRVDRYDDAITCIETTLELSNAKEDLYGQAIDLTNLGELYIATNKVDQAASCLEDSLDIYEQLGNQRGIHLSHLNLGLVYTRQENYSKAYKHLETARDYYQKVENFAFLGTVHNILGEWCLEQEKFIDALFHFEESLRQNSDNRITESNSWKYLGRTYCKMGAYKLALSHFSKARQINEETQQQSALAGIYMDMAETYEAQKQTVLAIEYLQNAYEIYRLLDAKFAEDLKEVEAQLARLRQID